MNSCGCPGANSLMHRTIQRMWNPGLFMFCLWVNIQCVHLGCCIQDGGPPHSSYVTALKAANSAELFLILPPLSLVWKGSQVEKGEACEANSHPWPAAAQCFTVFYSLLSYTGLCKCLLFIGENKKAQGWQRAAKCLGEKAFCVCRKTASDITSCLFVSGSEEETRLFQNPPCESRQSLLTSFVLNLWGLSRPRLGSCQSEKARSHRQKQQGACSTSTSFK